MLGMAVVGDSKVKCLSVELRASGARVGNIPGRLFAGDVNTS